MKSVDTHAHGNDPISAEACWALLERVAASPHLGRATRLKEFLFYVGSKTVKEGNNDVHEQEIGHAVFGRREAYDTSQDNIVRVSATELRKRIDAYFASEGANDALIFEIPRGSYAPIFRMREASPQAAAPVADATAALNAVPTPAASPFYVRLPFLLVSALVLVLGIACAWLWTQNYSLRQQIHPWLGKPALAAFWPRFLDSPQETDIVLADTSFMLVEDLMKQSFSLSDYLNRSYDDQLHSIGITTDRGPVKSISFLSIATRPNGSFGDFKVALRIKELDHGSSHVEVEYARDYTTDAIKQNNVILIGSRKSNPWVDLFSDRMNFTIKYDTALDQSFVVNLHPRAGEQQIYAQPANPDDPLGYSVIAYLPNPSHTGNALIIEGTNAEATNAAGDFLTSESSLESFLKNFPPNNIPYFEVLLKTTRMSGTPLHADIVAYRTH